MKTSYITIGVLIVLAAMVLAYMHGWVHWSTRAHQGAYIATALLIVVMAVIVGKRRKKALPPQA
jgi:uncharacterized oligopeptide transporter (OPT) family protein